MKTNLIVLTMILFSTLSIAQSFKADDSINYMTDPTHPKTLGEGEPIDDIRKVGLEYKEVVVGNGIQLYVASGTSDQIRLKAQKNLLPLVETVVDGNQLIVRLTKSLQTEKGIKLYLPINKLEKITIKEGGFVQTEQPITANVMDLTLQGGSAGNCAFNVADFHCRLRGGSELNLSGQASDANVLVKENSRLEGKAFIAEESKVTVLSSSSCKLKTAAGLEARVENESKLYYYGTPEIRKQEVALNGVIRKKGK